MYQQGASSQLPNGGKLGSEGVVVIPTIDGETAVGSPEGARVNLLDLEVRCSERVASTSNSLSLSFLPFSKIKVSFFPFPLLVCGLSRRLERSSYCAITSRWCIRTSRTSATIVWAPGSLLFPRRGPNLWLFQS